METRVLQDFLSLRLLNIGAEDSRLEKLLSACHELAQQYGADPKAAVASLLAAWDPAAGPHQSLLDIGELLQKHWPTFRGAFQDEPLTLYRAIILEAVMQAMEQQGTLAVAVSLIGANVLPHLNVGQEEQILSKILERARKITSERVERLWPKQSKPVTSAAFKAPAIAALKATEPTTWHTQVAASAGPTKRDQTSLPNANPHWSHQPQNWSYDFADRMAPILADVHDKAANAALKASTQALKALGDSIVAKLNDFLSSEQTRSNQLNISNKLLWWRQALYSETASTSYRQLALPVVAIHAALDVAHLLPEVYPPAVESLVIEAVLAVAGSKNEELISTKDLLNILMQSPGVPDNQWLQEQRTASGGRSLFIQALANSSASGKAELSQMSIAGDVEMTLAAWTVWLLREVKVLDALAKPDEIPEPAEEA
ncbi:GTPase-associated system all-helical protein GASH [Janthinobacterium lividum]